MSKICQITGKKAMVGNNVSHSKRRTKRTFDVNLFTKKFYYVEQDCWISLKISAAGLRLINKVGLDAALNNAVSKGYCDWKIQLFFIIFTAIQMHIRQSKEYPHKQVILFYYEYIKKVIGILLLESNNLKTLIVF